MKRLDSNGPLGGLIAKYLFPGADNISNPDAPLALRLSGQLLLGVVKLHSKKIVYLFQDANDALVKVKQVTSYTLNRLHHQPLPFHPEAVCKYLGTGLQGRGR